MNELRSLAIELACKDATWSLMPLLVVANDTGKIVMVHKSTAAIFGYEVAELFDQPVELLVPDVVRAVHARLRQETVGLSRPMAYGRRVLGRHKDGTAVPVHVSLTEVWTTEKLVLALIIDLSGVAQAYAVEQAAAVKAAVGRVIGLLGSSEGVPLPDDLVNPVPSDPSKIMVGRPAPSATSAQ